MRKTLVAVIVCAVVSLYGFLGQAAEVRAECTTQGAYALALAQVLQFDVSTVEAAISALTGIGAAPDGGWQPEVCLTDAVALQVRAALERAVAAGAVPPGIGTGAASAAFEALATADRRYPVSGHQP